ncbi:MAG: hypothetical protein AAFR04_03530 [Pseudomonadota bacterium]
MSLFAATCFLTAPAQAARINAAPAFPSELTPAQPSTGGDPLAWLAIDDAETGVRITLGNRWRETPHSPAHEAEVLASSDWYFSRIYACEPPGCGRAMQVTLSGGKLPPGFDIRTAQDVKRTIPVADVVRLSSMIAGAPVEPAMLRPIHHGAGHGYRIVLPRRSPGYAPNAVLIIDCIYRGDRFVVMTIQDDTGGSKTLATPITLLDEIARTLTFTPRAKASK